jgi:hypothetical protein
MTKVQARYEILRPPDDTFLEAIGRAHGIYGLLRLQIAPDSRTLLVDFDASRLTLADLDRAMLQEGLPLRRES